MAFSTRSIGGALVLFGAVLTAQAFVPPPAQNPVTVEPKGAPVPAAPPAGRGGGRGNPTAGLFTERCAGCHGAGIEGGRAPSLFDDVWTRATDDEGLRKVIHDGVQGTEMVPFAATLNDQQIWQLVAYIRTQAATLKGKPTYVADPDGQVIKSEKQTFKIEVVAPQHRDALGPRISARRTAADHGAPRTRPHRRKRASCCLMRSRGHRRSGKSRMADSSMSRCIRSTRRTAGSICRTPKWCPDTSPPPPAEAPAAGAPSAPAAAAPPQGGRGRGGPPDPPSMTVIVRGKIDKNNEWTDQQVIFRGAPEVYSSTNAHYGSRFIVRQAGPSVLHARRKEQPGATRRICRTRSARSIASTTTGRCRRTTRSSDKPSALPTIWSYGHRNPQGLAWDPERASCGNRSTGRRVATRSTSSSLATTTDGASITMGVSPAMTERTHEGMEQPIVYYTPTIAPSGIVFYTGTKYPRLEEQLVRQRARRTAAAAARDERTQGHARRNRCSTSSAASTTSSSARMDISTSRCSCPVKACRSRHPGWSRGWSRWRSDRVAMTAIFRLVKPHVYITRSGARTRLRAVVSPGLTHSSRVRAPRKRARRAAWPPAKKPMTSPSRCRRGGDEDVLPAARAIASSSSRRSR